MTTGYFLQDGDQEAETVRLQQLHLCLSRYLGKPMPEQAALAHVRRVLDVGCGPGGWALDLAARFPQMALIGIDTSPTRLVAALAQAHARGLANVDFLRMDVRESLAFPDASFDLIHARFAQSFLPRASWPSFLTECRRLLRPGGSIWLMECENPISTELSLERLSACYAQACRSAGTGCTPAGSALGITAMLACWLRQAGYAHVTDLVQALEWSSGTAAHADLVSYFQALLPLATPFLVRMGTLSQYEAEALSQQALAEMRAPDFGAIWYFRTVRGYRPTGMNR